MLTIVTDSVEYYNDETAGFVYVKAQRLTLEHSLVSISKWEATWNKPFLGKDPKTDEEVIDYIKCMTITQNVKPIIYRNLSKDNNKAISDYLEAPMTATILPKDNSGTSREVVTSELVYYWMIALNIPMECQKWHFNRLLTLINVCDIKSKPPNKRNARDIAARNRKLNAERRAKFKTKG